MPSAAWLHPIWEHPKVPEIPELRLTLSHVASQNYPIVDTSLEEEKPSDRIGREVPCIPDTPIHTHIWTLLWSPGKPSPSQLLEEEIEALGGERALRSPSSGWPSPPPTPVQTTNSWGLQVPGKPEDPGANPQVIRAAVKGCSVCQRKPRNSAPAQGLLSSGRTSANKNKCRFTALPVNLLVAFNKNV